MRQTNTTCYDQTLRSFTSLLTLDRDISEKESRNISENIHGTGLGEACSAINDHAFRHFMNTSACQNGMECSFPSMSIFPTKANRRLLDMKGKGIPSAAVLKTFSFKRKRLNKVNFQSHQSKMTASSRVRNDDLNFECSTKQMRQRLGRVLKFSSNTSGVDSSTRHISLIPQIINTNIFSAIERMLDLRLKYYLSRLVQKKNCSNNGDISKEVGPKVEVENQIPTEIQDQIVVEENLRQWYLAHPNQSVKDAIEFQMINVKIMSKINRALSTCLRRGTTISHPNNKTTKDKVDAVQERKKNASKSVLSTVNYNKKKRKKYERENCKEVQSNERTERNSSDVSEDINEIIYPKTGQDTNCIPQLSSSKDDLNSDVLKRVLLKISGEKRLNKIVESFHCGGDGNYAEGTEKHFLLASNNKMEQIKNNSEKKKYGIASESNAAKVADSLPSLLVATKSVDDVSKLKTTIVTSSCCNIYQKNHDEVTGEPVSVFIKQCVTSFDIPSNTKGTLRRLLKKTKENQGSTKKSPFSLNGSILVNSIENELEYTLPITFAAIVNLDVGGKDGINITLQFGSSGLIQGTFCGPQSHAILTGVKVSLDTDSLFQSILSQVKIAVRKATVFMMGTPIQPCITNLQKQKKEYQEIEKPHAKKRKVTDTKSHDLSYSMHRQLSTQRITSPQVTNHNIDNGTVEHSNGQFFQSDNASVSPKTLRNRSTQEKATAILENYQHNRVSGMLPSLSHRVDATDNNKSNLSCRTSMLSAHSSIALNERKGDSLDDHTQAAQALSQSFKNESGNSNPIAGNRNVVIPTRLSALDLSNRSIFDLGNKKALDHQISHENISSSSIRTNTINLQNHPHTISPNTTAPLSKKKTKDCVNNRRFNTAAEVIKIERRVSATSAMTDAVRQMNKDLEESLPSNILKSKKPTTNLVGIESNEIGKLEKRMKFKRSNSNSQISDNSTTLTETGLNFEIENMGAVRRKSGNLSGMAAAAAEVAKMVENDSLSMGDPGSNSSFTTSAEAVRLLELENLRRSNGLNYETESSTLEATALAELEKMSARVDRNERNRNRGRQKGNYFNSMAAASEAAEIARIVERDSLSSFNIRRKSGTSNSSLTTAAERLAELDDFRRNNSNHFRRKSGTPNGSLTVAAETVRMLELDNFRRNSVINMNLDPSTVEATRLAELGKMVACANENGRQRNTDRQRSNCLNSMSVAAETARLFDLKNDRINTSSIRQGSDGLDEDMRALRLLELRRITGSGVNDMRESGCTNHNMVGVANAANLFHMDNMITTDNLRNIDPKNNILGTSNSSRFDLDNMLVTGGEQIASTGSVGMWSRQDNNLSRNLDSSRMLTSRGRQIIGTDPVGTWRNDSNDAALLAASKVKQNAIIGDTFSSLHVKNQGNVQRQGNIDPMDQRMLALATPSYAHPQMTSMLPTTSDLIQSRTSGLHGSLVHRRNDFSSNAAMSQLNLR